VPRRVARRSGAAARVCRVEAGPSRRQWLHREQAAARCPRPRGTGDRPEARRGAPQQVTPSPPVPNDGVVRIFRGKGGRGGKAVSVVRGLPRRDLAAVAQDLKKHCGSGGTVKDGAVEIQGDQREKIAERLSAQGYMVKLAGG